MFARVSDLVRRWCTLEGGFLSYYENEKNSTPIGRVDVSDVVSLAISNTENFTETGYVFPLPICLFLSHPVVNVLILLWVRG